MNAHPYPLTATVDARRAPTGMHAATVDSGYGERLFPGYLDRDSALAAGERFALAMGRRPVMPADYGEADAAPRVGRHGDGRRRGRRHARAMKSAWLDSLA